MEKLSQATFRKSKDEAYYLKQLVDNFTYTRGVNFVMVMEVMDIIYLMLHECGHTRTELERLADVGRMIMCGTDNNLKRAFQFCEMSESNLEDTVRKLVREYERGLLGLEDGVGCMTLGGTPSGVRAKGGTEVARQVDSNLQNNTRSKCETCGRSHAEVCYGKD